MIAVTTALTNEDARRAGNTTSVRAPKKLSQTQQIQSSTDELSRQIDQAGPAMLTPLQFKALYAIYQDGLRERGRFVVPRPGLSRPCPALVRHGLLEGMEVRRVWGRYRRASVTRAYRVTDAGRALLPRPSVPPAPVAPQRPVLLDAAGRHDLRAAIGEGWKDVRVLGHPDGCSLTAFFRLEPLPYGAPSAYSPAAFAEDMAVFVRRLLPRAAVTAVAAHPARAYPGDDQRAAGLKRGPNPVIKTDTIQRIRNVRRVAWAAVTFHLQEDMPLLAAGIVAAGPVALGDPVPSLLLIDPAPEALPAVVASLSPALLSNAVVRGTGSEVDDLPPITVDQQAIWNGLTVEAQAALVLLSGRPGWQPVRGVADSDLRALDHDLLIFWQRQLQEARITARGLDLVAVMVSVESVA